MILNQKADGNLYHKQGFFKLSNKHNLGFVITEHVIYDQHSILGVLHPSKNLLQSLSVVAVVPINTEHFQRGKYPKVPLQTQLTGLLVDISFPINPSHTDRLQINDLKLVCENKLQLIVYRSNVENIKKVANFCNAKQLTRYCEWYQSHPKL
ncbi:hypothetical protein pb186bvf_015984 [Paramecium bursaria]